MPAHVHEQGKENGRDRISIVRNTASDGISRSLRNPSTGRLLFGAAARPAREYELPDESSTELNLTSEYTRPLRRYLTERRGSDAQIRIGAGKPVRQIVRFTAKFKLQPLHDLELFGKRRVNVEISRPLHTVVLQRIVRRVKAGSCLNFEVSNHRPRSDCRHQDRHRQALRRTGGTDPCCR